MGDKHLDEQATVDEIALEAREAQLDRHTGELRQARVAVVTRAGRGAGDRYLSVELHRRLAGTGAWHIGTRVSLRKREVPALIAALETASARIGMGRVRGGR